MEDYIPHKEIAELLEKNSNDEKAEEIIEKSKKLKGLSPEEAAVLLNCKDKKLTEKMFSTAKEIKESIYGKRLVFFAPLYISNECTNNCRYCAFRVENRDLERKTLSMDEIKEETRALINQGHKRLLLVAGEHPEKAKIDFVEDAIEAVYSVKEKNGEIRRLNVNVAPLTVKEFERLKKTGIGTYQVFQETYHRETYKEMHPSGKKADYLWRLYAMDRAQEAGIDDVGIGALFGLYDYRFEVLGLLYHSLHLEEEFKVGPHTISIPRIEPALNAPAAMNPPYPVSDYDFKKLVAIIRMSVPYTGMILTTREKPGFRDEVFNLGISQISAGSRTNPGAYSKESKEKTSSQFDIHDRRSLAELISDICRNGFYPSFCTACYRSGRTGKDFMDLAKPGLIQNFCTPNCLFTFKEYLLDYGTPSMKELGEKVIGKELEGIKNKKIKEETKKRIKRLEKGERDLYF